LEGNQALCTGPIDQIPFKRKRGWAELPHKQKTKKGEEESGPGNTWMQKGDPLWWKGPGGTDVPESCGRTTTSSKKGPHGRRAGVNQGTKKRFFVGRNIERVPGNTKETQDKKTVLYSTSPLRT